MAKHLVKCFYCGEQFDCNSIPFVKINERRYAHEECEKNRPKEERDKEELEKYIKILFKKETIPAKIKKQINEYREEYKYSYSGILKTLKYWFEIKKESLEKTNGGIGIIPYIYEDAYNYYYRLYLAEIANNLEDIEKYQIKTKEIEIESPRAKIKKPKLFMFREDEENE